MPSTPILAEWLLGAPSAVRIQSHTPVDPRRDGGNVVPGRDVTQVDVRTWQQNDGSNRSGRCVRRIARHDCWQDDTEHRDRTTSASSSWTLHIGMGVSLLSSLSLWPVVDCSYWRDARASTSRRARSASWHGSPLVMSARNSDTALPSSRDTGCPIPAASRPRRSRPRPRQC